ncbi:MAG: sortase [Anaerolineae bacterium]
MRDKRPVDELSIEELERVLVIKKREARQKQLEQMRRTGRVVEPVPMPAASPSEASAPDAELSATPEESAAKDQVVKVPISASKSPRLAEMERLALQDQGLTPVFEDDFDSAELRPIDSQPTATPSSSSTAAPAGKPAKSAERRAMDRVLLLVEVIAVIGVVVIGVNMITAIGALERETSSAQQLAEQVRQAGIPTLEPTPTLRLENVVLPGGHTSPLDPGGAQFNYEEIPAIYRPLAQSEWVQPIIQRPPVTNEMAVAINIPRLNLDSPIVQGVDWEALKQGVGQLQNGINPGDVAGNLVFAAHNDIYGQLFRYLPEMQIGDPFQIRTQTQVYNYVVTDILFVEPNDVHVMEDRGGATATLISCYPYQVDNQRIVVFADRTS